MLPVIAIVGRPNVGKSTLFNRLTRSRDALVADFPGLTRDRHYGTARVGERPYLIIDTGGFEPTAKDGILYQMAQQTRQAVEESDLVIFLVDARHGRSPQETSIANFLRKTGRPVLLVINKAEGLDFDTAASDFYALGLGSPCVISAAHGDGIYPMVERLLEVAYAQQNAAAEEEQDTESKGIKLALVGRPNVGKSTLANAFLGEDRLIAFDQPGTTRDSIYIDFEKEGNTYTLIDTAGIRRRGRVFEAIEKFSVVKTLKAVQDANVVVLLLDARQDISEQDAHIASFILEQGRALVVVINKWEKLDTYTRQRVKEDFARKLKFLNFAQVHFISALEKTGLGGVLRSVRSAYEAAMAKLSTPKLTRALIAAVQAQPPRRNGLSRPKMRYAHQGGHNPPIVIIHGNGLDDVTIDYKRYLERKFRETFSLIGTPLRIEFRTHANPFLNKTK